MSIEIGDTVITWNDSEPRIYGGPSDDPAFESTKFDMRYGGTPTILCSAERVAPATVTIPDSDARVTTVKHARKLASHHSGPWELQLPGIATSDSSFFKTKRDAVAAGLRRLAILDFHANQTTDAVPHN